MPATASHQLSTDQRKDLRACLAKVGLSLRPDELDRLARAIAATIDCYREATEDNLRFRDAHDALRTLWRLCAADDPPIAMIRGRLKALPPQVIKHLEYLAPWVIGSRPTRRAENGGEFLAWAEKADGRALVDALRSLTAQGARWVEGRNRGAGKRSQPRLEPMILGETRGAGTLRHHGGAPAAPERQALIAMLAVDWTNATGKEPKASRETERGGFGELVCDVFQWVGISEAPKEEASYALRQYWKAIKEQRPVSEPEQ